MGRLKSAKKATRKVLELPAPSFASGQLRKLELRNWQSHAESAIEFAPGVTAVVGASNAGKSAIIRALQRVLRNAGPVAVRKGETTAQLRLVCGNGVAIERTLKVRHLANKKPQLVENSYRVDDQSFEAVDRSVPKEVLDAHGLAAGDLGDLDVDLHIGTQHSAAFLLAASASTRSKVLAFLSGVDLLDRCVQLENAKLRQLRADEDADAQRKVELELEQRAYSGVDTYKAQLTAFEQEYAAQCRRADDYARREKLLAQFVAARTQRRLLRAQLAAYEGVDLESMAVRLTRLQSILKVVMQWQAASRALADSEVAVTAARRGLLEANAAFAEFAGQVCPTCGRPLIDEPETHTSRCVK